MTSQPLRSFRLQQLVPNSEITKILKTQEAHEWFALQGGEETMATAEEFSAFIKAEYARWGKTIREAGIKAE